eukprot:364584-Chlamydomonas_euryale.AAC.9
MLIGGGYVAEHETCTMDLLIWMMQLSAMVVSCCHGDWQRSTCNGATAAGGALSAEQQAFVHESLCNNVLCYTPCFQFNCMSACVVRGSACGSAMRYLVHRIDVNLLHSTPFWSLTTEVHVPAH